MWKDRATISMFALEGLHKNSNVCKKRARILVFKRIRSKFQCVGPEFQRVDGLYENSNVYKSMARIPKISVEGQHKNSSVHKNRSRSPMFQKMTSKCNVYKNRARILMFGKIRS